MLTFSRPRETDPTPICGGAAFMQHRGDDTLIWPMEWDEEAPLGTISGRVGKDVAQAWYAGHLAGHEQGHREGRRRGFAECQAGLRALLGATPAADVSTLLDAVVQAGRD